MSGEQMAWTIVTCVLIVAVAFVRTVRWWKMPAEKWPVDED